MTCHSLFGMSLTNEDYINNVIIMITMIIMKIMITITIIIVV